MNNKAIIEFGFRRIWRILQISEGVIHLGLRPRWITLSSTCRIFHTLLGLIQQLLIIWYCLYEHAFVLLPLAPLSVLVSFSWMRQRDTQHLAVRFPGSYDSLSLTLGGQVVPLVGGFMRRDNLLAWHELFMNLYELKSRIWPIFVQTFLELWQTRKLVGKLIRYLTYFSRGVHLHNTSLEAEILTTNQNFEEAQRTLMPCEYDCTAISLMWRHQIADKFNRRTLGRFTPYRLLTLPESEKTRLTRSFIINCSYRAFFWYLVCWGFIDTGARTTFFPKQTLEGRK